MVGTKVSSLFIKHCPVNSLTRKSWTVENILVLYKTCHCTSNLPEKEFQGICFHDPMPHSSYVFSCHISSFRNCSTVYFYKSQSNDPLVSDDGIESCLSSFHKHVWNVLCIPYAVLGTLGNAKLSRECGSASRSLPQEKAWQFPSMMQNFKVRDTHVLSRVPSTPEILTSEAIG